MFEELFVNGVEIGRVQAPVPDRVMLGVAENYYGDW